MKAMSDLDAKMEEIRRVQAIPRAAENRAGRLQAALKPHHEKTSGHDQNQGGDDQGLAARLEKLQSRLTGTNIAFEITLDRQTGKNQVKIIDRDTGEVLREIPSEEAIKLEASIERMIGLFFDRRL